MPRRDNFASSDKEKRQAGATGNGREQKSVARPETKPRPWATIQKLQGGGKNVASRQKLPSGPLGGSGRKTNLARSS